LKFPTTVYKDGQRDNPNTKSVHNAKECLLALEEGWWSHRYKKEEIPGLFKAEIKEAEIEVKKEGVFARFMQKPVKTEAKLTPQQKANITKQKNKEIKDASK